MQDSFSALYGLVESSLLNRAFLMDDTAKDGSENPDLLQIFDNHIMEAIARMGEELL